MKPSRILLAVCTAVLLLASSASAAVPAPTPLPAPLLTPDKSEGNHRDGRRASYQIGGTEITVALSQTGGRQHFTLREGRQEVFHFIISMNTPSYGDIGAFTSGGYPFFYCAVNTSLAWVPNRHISGRAVIVGKSPVTGEYCVYVDSKNYYNPSPNDFQTVIVHTTLDGVPTMRLSFGKGLFSDLGGILATYYLRYDPSTDSFVYEER